MILGFLFGLALNYFSAQAILKYYITEGILEVGGQLFLNILKMLVIPIVFVSLVCGTFNLSDNLSLGKMASKTILLYILTTAIAITLALVVAQSFQIGSGNNLVISTKNQVQTAVPSIKETLLNILPSNPFAALAQGNMLQIIVFALLFGIACNKAGERALKIKKFFLSLDSIVMSLMEMVIQFAPIGVFCLVATMFGKVGIELIFKLAGYFFVVLLVLLLHLSLTYTALLHFLARLNPWQFIKKMLPAMLFAFSTSSSSASIPVVLRTVEKRLGIKESIASFVIPLGATINMDGTAIMQGVATVFIANSYNIHLSLAAFLKIILTATLASIGTAGIPSVGLITLTMVLMQVNLPAEGIALIIGVDRLLDMTRTAVNVTGDATVACVIAKSESHSDKPPAVTEII